MTLSGPLTLAILFATHALGGAAAFGSTLLALPLLLLAGWDLRPAVALLLLVGTAQSVSLACLTWRGADRRALGRILIAAGFGIPIGLLAADLLPERALGLLFGGLLIVAGATRLLEHGSRRPWTPPPWVLRLLLVVGGIIHGAFGSGGATLIVYARFTLREKDAFRGTLSIMWTALNLAVIAPLVWRGHVNQAVMSIGLAGIPAVLLATWVGHRWVAGMSQERFALLVAVLLCLAGALTLARNVRAERSTSSSCPSWTWNANG